MTFTRTYAKLEVSVDTYDEISEALRKVDYDHAFMDNGIIDMQGIGLTKKQQKVLANTPPSQSYVAQHERTCKHPYSSVASENCCWCHEKMGNDFWFLPADTCVYEKPNWVRDNWRNLWANIKRFCKGESSGHPAAPATDCTCPQRPKNPHHPCFHHCAKLGGRQ